MTATAAAELLPILLAPSGQGRRVFRTSRAASTCSRRSRRTQNRFALLTAIDRRGRCGRTAGRMKQPISATVSGGLRVTVGAFSK